MNDATIAALATVAGATLTTIAAIVAPLINARINSHSAYQVKATELFFNARIKAYKDFLTAVSHFPLHPTQEQIQDFQDVGTYALLFSSRKTQDKMSRFSTLLVHPNQSPQYAKEFSEAKEAMILAMQQDISKYQHKRKRNNKTNAS